MTSSTDSLDVESLIARQRPGFTLDQPFYTHPDIFTRDFERIISRKWLFADHVSRIPNPGDYFLYEVAGESIIVLRGGEGEVRAFFNVCRHRGSRIRTEPEGHAARLVCPYHAWSYGLDGRCIRARGMPGGFDPEPYGLHPCRVRVFQGLIYLCLSRDHAPDFDVIAEHVGPYIAPHRIERARIAHRETFPTNANWKLVVENFRECAHCLPAHPEYTATYAYVHEHERSGLHGHDDAVAAWNEKVGASGMPTGLTMWDDTFPDQPHYGRRRPIGNGRCTLTADGEPVAPLMGDFKEYDGGDTVVWLHPLHAFWGTNDHVTLFRFTPVHARLTEVELIWLVREDAKEGVDYDLARLAWLWHETTVADTRIINDNQKGVDSRCYLPGPYMELEAFLKDVTAWYLDQIRDPAPPFMQAGGAARGRATAGVPGGAEARLPDRMGASAIPAAP